MTFAKVRNRVKWVCPPSDRHKVNFDGAFRPGCRGGLGVVRLCYPTGTIIISVNF
ncbi:hypothetical protein RchiOBHm_Chr5g0055221 [Rosa chinensis]|uniref:Uncharacterized protein n=1 Tax=Rosa chinensis TaxID=74649 RepID=A0A2P6QGC0_ROSCH|nr:hypothetical protein RchiOBHm_Chr5g0055221 [Rosa chinensis]